MFTVCPVLYCACMHACTHHLSFHPCLHPPSIHPCIPPSMYTSIHHPSMHPPMHAAVINSLSHLSVRWSSHLSFHLLCTESPVLKYTLHVTTLHCNQRKLAFSSVKMILISFILNCFICKIVYTLRQKYRDIYIYK